MAYTNGNDAFHTPIIRYYVDVRPHAPISAKMHLNPPKREGEQLPLLSTLPKEIQDSVTRYVRKPDRFMSLSSALLKYLFIHKTAKIPWCDVKISRTPKPHSRPYWAPPAEWSRKGFQGLEFNVSHQAGVVILVGCKTPAQPRDARIDDQDEISIRSPAVINPDPTAVLEADSEIDEDEPEDVRIGVDVACTWEPPRTPDLSTQVKFDEWVEVFGEMFSAQEQHDMKHAPVAKVLGMSDLDLKARRFYTYWALKEAYIKMVGEGLLAPWLRELQFRDVQIPATPRDAGHDPWSLMTGEGISKLGVLFGNKNISKTMSTSLEAFEDTFVIATMTRGVIDYPQNEVRWEKIDVFGDIELCATGKCHCLD